MQCNIYSPVTQNDTAKVYNLTSQILSDLTSIEMLLSEIQDIRVHCILYIATLP